MKIYQAIQLVGYILDFDSVIGEVPPHLLQFKQELEKTFQNLDAKNQLLISSMQKNFGKTHQELPNFRLPEIVQS